MMNNSENLTRVPEEENATWPPLLQIENQTLVADGDTIGLTQRLWSDESCAHPSPSDTAPLTRVHVWSLRSHQQSVIFWLAFYPTSGCLETVVRAALKDLTCNLGQQWCSAAAQAGWGEVVAPSGDTWRGRLTWFRTARHQTLLQYHWSPWAKNIGGHSERTSSLNDTFRNTVN